MECIHANPGQQTAGEKGAARPRTFFGEWRSQRRNKTKTNRLRMESIGRHLFLPQQYASRPVPSGDRHVHTILQRSSRTIGSQYNIIAARSEAMHTHTHTPSPRPSQNFVACIHPHFVLVGDAHTRTSLSINVAASPFFVPSPITIALHGPKFARHSICQSHTRKALRGRGGRQRGKKRHDIFVISC